MRQNVRSRPYLKVPPGGVEAAVPMRHGPLRHKSPAVTRKFFKADDDGPGGKEADRSSALTPRRVWLGMCRPAFRVKKRKEFLLARCSEGH